MKEIVARLKLGPHYKMERFAITFILLISCLCVLTGIAYARELDRRKVHLNNEPILTEKFMLSLSEVKGTVVDVYGNNDGTVALMLLRFDNMSQISANAQNWRMYYSALNEKRLNNPDGIIYVFGNTGYVGLLFSDPEGFQVQVSDIILQHTSNLVSQAASSAPEADAFEKFDMAQLWVNLGASDVKYLQPLDDLDNLNIYSFLSLTIYAEDEELLREKAEEHLSTMAQSLAAMDELVDRLRRKNVVIPEFPMYVGGVATTDGDGGLYIKFADIMPGGYDYDWRNTSLKDGYARLVVHEDNTLREHMLYMTNERAIVSTSIAVSNYNWYFEDGTFLPLRHEGDGPLLDFEEEARADINALTQEWRSFYNARYQYQVNVLQGLLSLEENLMVQRVNFSVNDDEKVIVLYEQK